MYIHLFFLCLFSQFISCSPKSYKSELKDLVSSSYIGIMQQEEHMIPMGSGASMMNKIEDLIFIFVCPRLVDVNEARRTTLRITHRYLELINNFKEIRPYLAEYPVPPSRLELTISFNPDRTLKSIKDSCHVSTIFLSEGEIYYRKYDADKDKEVTVLIETYEEALQNACGS